MTTKIYRLAKPDGEDGWMEVRNYEDYQPPIEWREATRREWLWRQVTKPRFSWLELLLIQALVVLISNLWQALT